MTEPLGGQPPEGSQPSVPDLDFQATYQRAFEAMHWGHPAAAIYRFRAEALEELGVRDNDIIAYSDVATPKLEAITANSATPYICAYSDLQQGPVVIDIPASGDDGMLYGQVVDAWQFTIAEVGPAGLDKGKGGKYLFTPPGYDGDIPEGYIHLPSPNYRIALAFRSVVAPGKTIADAHAYAQRMRMYYLSEADNPPEQRFLDPIEERYPTLPFYDERYIEDVAAIVSLEPPQPYDAVMLGQLATLGIKYGEPYTPDEAIVPALRHGVIDSWYYLQDRFDQFPAEKLYWPDRHYVSIMQPDTNSTFTYVYPDGIDIEARAMQYAWCTYAPKVQSARPTHEYLVAIADAAGNLLEAGKTYRLTVRADMPVEQFWSLTIYDRRTFAFIYTPLGRTNISSVQLEGVKVNDDGSVTLYVGPSEPEGWEGNWIDTAGKRPMPLMRFYGASDALFDTDFTLPDFDEVTKALLARRRATMTQDSPTSEPAATQPNVLYFQVDNLGYGELGCYGGGVLRGARTERIDAFAGEGLQLLNFAPEAQCTPSRSALMTGRHAIRSGTHTVASSASSGSGLVAWERTLGDLFADAGYATMCMGKWHIGDAAGRWPTDHGVDAWFGPPHSYDEALWEDDPWYDPTRDPVSHMLESRKGEPVQEVTLLTKDVKINVDAEYKTRALRFIEESARAGHSSSTSTTRCCTCRQSRARSIGARAATATGPTACSSSTATSATCWTRSISSACDRTPSSSSLATTVRRKCSSGGARPASSKGRTSPAWRPRCARRA
jgi:hypothetical protein